MDFLATTNQARSVGDAPEKGRPEVKPSGNRLLQRRAGTGVDVREKKESGRKAACSPERSSQKGYFGGAGEGAGVAVALAFLLLLW